MADALAPIPNKLRRCVRLLSSARDGEVVAAARALCHTLKSSELDIQALADNIGRSNSAGRSNGIDPAEEKRIYARGFEAGQRAAARNRSEPSWHEIACECAEHPEVLHSEREREFVEHMVRHTVHGGKLSEKQADWLRKIYARLGS